MIKKPILLHYFITNRCNEQCSFCTIWQEQPKVDALGEQVIANLVEAKKLGCKFVDFTGGEPLLHPDLPLFLSEAKKNGFITSVTTNTRLFPKRVHELAGKIDLLHFSLDGGTAECHNKIHGSDSFESVLESITLARKFNMAPDLLFTYTNENINTFEAAQAIARKNGIMILLDPLFSLDGKDPNSFETHNTAKKFARLSNVYLNRAHLSLRSWGGNQQAKPLCKSVTSTIVILPDNQMALPCFHHKTDSISLKPSLTHAYHWKQRKEAEYKQGTYPFCGGCHINCYFDPSFSYSISPLLFKSIGAKGKYALQKYLFLRNPLPSIF